MEGAVVKFRKEQLPEHYKIPHMRWTNIDPAPGYRLFEEIAEPRYYFVHSFHIETGNDELVTSTAEYGYRFPASVARGNVHGVQFHPEKSHRFGMQLYRNFYERYCNEKS